MEGIDRGVWVGPGVKSRRLKKRVSVGVAGARAVFVGLFRGEADCIRRWPGVLFWRDAASN
jgi:hypothetical protein